MKMNICQAFYLCALFIGPFLSVVIGVDSDYKKALSYEWKESDGKPRKYTEAINYMKETGREEDKMSQNKVHIYLSYAFVVLLTYVLLLQFGLWYVSKYYAKRVMRTELGRVPSLAHGIEKSGDVTVQDRTVGGHGGSGAQLSDGTGVTRQLGTSTCATTQPSQAVTASPKNSQRGP